nr:hypothetical protein CFP56_00566 [Quercus suber]
MRRPLRPASSTTRAPVASKIAPAPDGDHWPMASSTVRALSVAVHRLPHAPPGPELRATLVATERARLAMSQQQHYEYPPPPPPPSGQPSPSGEYPSYQRRRPAAAQPPSITTTFAGPVVGYSQTPLTAQGTPSFRYSPDTPAGLNLRTPSALNPAAASRTPSTPMEPYNPQQWSGRSGQVSGAQMVFGRGAAMPVSTREITGMEAAMPSPPPPYSPETPNGVHTQRSAPRASPMLESAGFTASPITATPARHSPGPNVSMSPAFPPPPPQSSRHRERSASGLAGQRGFLAGLSAGLRGKQPATPEVHTITPVQLSQVVDARPPAARRAVSTGGMQHSAVAPVAMHGQSGRTSPDPPSWQPGMPLPPPPPGAPPPGARSQSLNRYAPNGSRSNSITSEHTLEAPPQRRVAAISTLGPVPPTPADWVDSDHSSGAQTVQPGRLVHSDEYPAQPLHINTGTPRDASLTRRPAKRDASAGGIRERRSRSKQAVRHDGDGSRPSDLVFTPVGGTISRRRGHVRDTSGYGEPSSAPLPSSAAPGSAKLNAKAEGPTNIMTPPYTPAVGNQESDISRKHALRVPNSASSDRPISHLLHTPNEDSAMQAPLSPARPASSGLSKFPTRLDPFHLQAIERHKAFVDKEASAATDEERLELFANFMVHESRVRRDRYAAAYNAMAGDIVDLTRDMWRPYKRGSKRAVTPSTSISSMDQPAPSWTSDGQPTSAHGNMPSSASSMGDFTPGTENGSTGDVAEGAERSESRQWGEQFKPSLSPIPSMAVSTVPDEDSSRGRQPSRWWEASQSGGGSIGRPDRIEKSRRETKYMGVNMATLHDDAQPSPGDMPRATPPAGASSPAFAYGPDEYPPEKTGWHDGNEFDTPMPTPAKQGELRHSVTSPHFEPLDVSRLVTLPPPYPRHHPAISNSHPLLGELRNEHRVLADHTEIQQIKDKYLDVEFAGRNKQQQKAKDRRASLRASIQRKIADGSISFAEAAKAEADFDAAEPDRGRADARANFDLFEANLAHPLNTLLTEQLARANKCIGELRSELDSINETSDPNQAQEEGDEQPERLEKLTLLKWLFEAREQLHKEMFELHAQRSDKYSEVILTPYRISKLQNKIDEATTFFAKDSRERHMTFAKDSIKRFEELQAAMERNVSRGVEDQLSAFWDIAPNLVEVISHVPADMSGFDVLIAAQEYDENPSYHDYPLQYLYSLLSHAEKSAYQFIESQTNLLCLLHEVRTARMNCSLRLIELERSAAAPDDREERTAALREARCLEEDRLTEDLKDKVGEVERQWKEALGDEIGGCKDRVRGWLEGHGGWEDGLDE